MTLYIDPRTGLPTRQKPPSNATLGGEPKNQPPFTNPVGRAPTTPSATVGQFDYQQTATIPGYTPDYASLIANDPTYLQLQKDLAAQGVSDAASRNASINRALVGFGEVPDLNAASQQLGITGLSGYVDPATAGLAAKNQYSTEANLARAHTDAIRSLRQNLAARHALQSGELGFQLQHENTAYGQAQNDATQKLLDYLGGVQSAFVQAERARQMQLMQAAADTANRVASEYPATGSQTATYDAGLSAQYGYPVYRGPDGKLYTGNGQPVTGGPRPSTQPGGPPVPVPTTVGHTKLGGYQPPGPLGPHIPGNPIHSFGF